LKRGKKILTENATASITCEALGDGHADGVANGVAEVVWQGTVWDG